LAALLRLPGTLAQLLPDLRGVSPRRRRLEGRSAKPAQRHALLLEPLPPEGVPATEGQAVTEGPKFGMIPTLAVRDPELNPGDVRVLADLCTYADADGWTTVSPHRIAKDIGLDRTTVVHHQQKLHKLGWLNKRSEGRGLRTYWRVIRDKGCAPSAQGVCADGTERVRSAHTEQTNNKPEEQTKNLLRATAPLSPSRMNASKNEDPRAASTARTFKQEQEHEHRP